MALFWSVVAGEVDQQIELPSTSVGSVRMIAVDVESGTLLPDGEMEGQLLMWTFDGTPRWVPVPNNGAPVAAAWGLKNTNDADPCSLNLGDGTVALVGLTAQMTSRLGQVIARVTDDAGGGVGEWQMSYSDGENLTGIQGTPNQITITAANDPGGNILLSSSDCTQTMSDTWQVAIDEAAYVVRLEPPIGFSVIVPSASDITLHNGRSDYRIQSDDHLFRNPDVGGSPTDNVRFGSAAGVMVAGFFGAAPVPRQVLFGDTTQQQVDGLAEALTQLGLTTDSRSVVPGPFIQHRPNDAMASQVVEAIPASAPSGFYLVSVVVNTRVQGAGGASSTLTWTTAGGIATSISLPGLSSSPGLIPTVTQQARTVEFGTGLPLNWTITSTLVGADCDLATVATYLGPIPPP